MWGYSTVRFCVSDKRLRISSPILLCILGETGVTVSLTSSVPQFSRSYQECITKTKSLIEAIVLTVAETEAHETDEFDPTNLNSLQSAWGGRHKI